MNFVIHSLNMIQDAIEYEKKMGEKFYIPGRDTNQKQHGDYILQDNLKALKKCDKLVYCFWDGESLGSMFDMGMAYALGYTILPIKIGEDKHWKRYFTEKYLFGHGIECDNREDVIDESSD